MNPKKHPFTPNYAENPNNLPYLGSDGLSTAVAHNLYVNKCAEFKEKARKYSKDNSYLKNSTLHHTKVGYVGSMELEEKVLLERQEHLNNYKKAFQTTLFDEDPNSMYECSTGKSKRIRIIRELNEVRNEEFTDEVENKRVPWFTRYCVLSRFIESARKIIFLNRLKKVLPKLKTLTPDIIEMFQDEDDIHIC